MATHKVEISAGAPPMKGTRRANNKDLPSHSRGVDIERDVDDHGVIGLEHKTPLSEAVLKAVGLYGGTVPKTDPKGTEPETAKAHERARAIHKAQGKSGTVERDLRDSEGAIFLPAPAGPDDCRNTADVVRYLESKYAGYFETTRVRQTEGKGKGWLRTARLTYGETADIVTGSGKTVRDAVKALAAKLGESFPCLEPDYDETEGPSDE